MDFLESMMSGEASRTQQIVDQLSSAHSSMGGFSNKDIAGAALSMESMGQSHRAQLKDSVGSLRSLIKRVVGDEKLSVAQESAGAAAGVIAAAAEKHFRAPVATAQSLAAQANEFTTVVGSLGMESIGRLTKLATEAYDNRDNENIAANSIRYNLAAAKQSPMVEMLFPTKTMLPGQFAFETSITLRLLQNDARHALNGAQIELNRRNMIKGYVDPTLMANESLRLYPVVRSGAAAVNTTQYFVDPSDVAPRTVVTHDGSTVTTAPLLVGKEFNLLALGQSDAAIANGQFDVTDAIDSAVRMERIYVKLGTNGGGKVIAFDTSFLAGAHFNQVVQGNTRKLQLTLETSSLKVDADTKAVDGAAIAELAALGTNVVRLAVSLTGSLVQDTGKGAVQALPLSVASVHSDTKEILSTASGSGKAAADLFVGATVIGFEPFANRTNSNIRTRGQQINVQKVRQLYAIPYLSPIHAVRPIGETDANDSDALDTLISGTNIRMTNDGVTALLRQVESVKAFYSANDSSLAQPEGFGVARYLTNVSYKEASIDVATRIDSLTTAQRTADLKALLINTIRDMATKLYIESQYGPALLALKGPGRKTKVLVACDPEIHQYLMVDGDTRTLSEMFDVEIQHDYDERMRGRVIVTFGTEEGARGEYDPMHFGVTAWRPELTVALPMNRNGQISHEMIVQPSYLQVPNLQIVGQIFVSNLSAVVADKVSVSVQNHPV